MTYLITLYFFLIYWILYTYNIPREGNSQEYRPEKCDYISPVAAKFGNHILRDYIFDYHPFRECNIYILSNTAIVNG